MKALHFAAFMRPVGIHTAWWRYPGADPWANFSWPALKIAAQKLEEACFDAFFMADHLALMHMPMSALKRSATVTSFDPATLLPAISAVTEKIGLIATASTSYEAPYHVARRFACLDHISGGRAGWNLVTTVNPEAAKNFGNEEALGHQERYEKGREFFDVVTGLWDSWADDAFIVDVPDGIFFDPHKLHSLNHRGKYFNVSGPLNVARPVQGWPVIVQAGASDAGIKIAAETAEVVFGNSKTMRDSQQYYSKLKGMMDSFGRNPSHLKVMPGVVLYIGETREEAYAKKAMIDSLVHEDSGMPNLSVRLGVDVSTYPLDEPLSEIPETNEGKGNRQAWLDLAKRDGLTLRQLAKLAGQSGWLEFIGTPADIGDMMEEWNDSGACDGFNVMFHSIPEGIDDFLRLLAPELRRRGLLRRNYEGRTLRDHLGLPKPKNRFFS